LKKNEKKRTETGIRMMIAAVDNPIPFITDGKAGWNKRVSNIGPIVV